MAEALYDAEIEEDLDGETASKKEVGSLENSEEIQTAADEVVENQEPSEDDSQFVEPAMEEEPSGSFVIDEGADLKADQAAEAESQVAKDEGLDQEAFEEARRSGGSDGSTKNLMERIKDNPIMALPLVAGIVILMFSLSSFLSFGAEDKHDADKKAVEEDLPLIEEPKGIDSLTEADITRRMAEQARKDLQKKERERLKSEQERNRIYQAEAARRLARADDSRLGSSQPMSGPVTCEERVQHLERELAMLKAGRVVEKHQRKSDSRRGSRRANQQKHAVVPEASADAQRDNVPAEQAKIPVRTAGFFKAGVTIQRPGQGEEGPGTSKSIPAGTVIRAQLKMGVRTDVRSEVLAKVTQPVKDSNGEVAIPAGSILHGRARAEKRRVLLDFSQASFSGSRVAVRGYAVWQNMPGLVGKVIRKARHGGGSRDNILERGAKSTVRGLVTRIPGAGVAGDMARNVAGAGVSDLGDDYSGGYSSSEAVLEIKAGKRFEIIVTGD